MKKYNACILALILAGTPLLAAGPSATPSASPWTPSTGRTISNFISSNSASPTPSGTGTKVTTSGSGALSDSGKDATAGGSPATTGTATGEVASGTFELAITPPAANLPPPKILPFPQDESDMKPDPNARFGTLPNGLRYVILPNHTPEGRVSMRLLVLAGSLEETEQQRGLAHFLEHMAFNGSAHYPLDTNTDPPTPTLIYYLQHMGMGFGGDLNASTSFDHTLYLLKLP
ncbi:MAG TPA: insulinase family protein, partial [Chthoniobacteraceae bacterium]|nr:insulinase family protein [Chthoniobacteraceae bacterium]